MGESTSWKQSIRLFVDGQEKAKDLHADGTSVLSLFAKVFLDRHIESEEWKAIYNGHSLPDFAAKHGFQLRRYHTLIFWRETEAHKSEPCHLCGGENDDGEGWDGMCGNCADAQAEPALSEADSTHRVREFGVCTEML